MKWFIIILLVLTTLIAVGIGTDTFSVTNVASGSFISVPTYGFLKCEQSDNVVSVPNTFAKFDSRIIKCADTGNVLPQECTVVLKTPSKDEIGNVKNSALLYSVCSDSNCNIGDGDRANEEINLKNLYFWTDNVDMTINIKLQPGQYIKAEYQYATLTSGVRTDNLGRFKIDFKPFFIYRYDVFSQTNGQKVIGTEDCVNADNLGESNFLIKDIMGDGDLSRDLSESQILNARQLQSRGAVANYISNFVAVTPQFNLFEDDSKYCYDKKVYAVEEIITNTGSYKVANTNSNKVLETVECCNNGDVPVNYKCVDFKKVALSTPESCNAFNPCDFSVWTSVGSKRMVIEECINSECVRNFETVECAYNEDCSGGYCEIDTAEPKNNKCVMLSPIETCGNQVCENSIGENFNNCPNDCQAPTQGDFNLALLLVTIVLGLVGAGFVYFKTPMLSKTKPGNIFRWVIVGLSFVAIFFLIPWVYNGVVRMFSGGLF